MSRRYPLNTEGNVSALPSPRFRSFFSALRLHTFLIRLFQAFKRCLSTLRVTERNRLESLTEEFCEVEDGIVINRGPNEYDLAGGKKRLRLTEAVLAAKNAGLLSFDQTGMAKSANSSARGLLGSHRYPIEMGAPIWRAVDPKSPLGVWLTDRINAYQRTGPDTVHASSDMHERSFLIGAGHISDGKNAGQEVVFVFQGALPCGALSTQPVQPANSSELGMIIETFTHDIRNSLSTIKVFIDLFPLKKDRPGFLDKFSHLVPREILRMEQMVSELRRLKDQIDSRIMGS